MARPLRLAAAMLWRTALWLLFGGLVGFLVSLPFEIEGAWRPWFHLAMGVMGALVAVFVQTGAKAIEAGRVRRRRIVTRRAPSPPR